MRVIFVLMTMSGLLIFGMVTLYGLEKGLLWLLVTDLAAISGDYCRRGFIRYLYSRLDCLPRTKVGGRRD